MKEKYGQYMTPQLIVDFMISLISFTDKKIKIIEPSAGKGIFLSSLNKLGYDNCIGYEIDEGIINTELNIINESFVSVELNDEFDVVIGNPPYIRWKNLEDELKEEVLKNELFKKYLNTLNDYSSIFIIKSIEALKDGGELIFITPDYWMDTTQSANLRNYMVEKGYFTDIFLFKETPIFKNVNISLQIFKFVKDVNQQNKKEVINVIKYDKRTEIDEIMLNKIKNKIEDPFIDRIQVKQFEKNKPWLFANSTEIEDIDKIENCCKINMYDYCKLEDVCEIGNGMVSGLDKAFQIPNDFFLNNDEKNAIASVIKAKELSMFKYSNVTKYIFLNELSDEKVFNEKYPNFKKHLNSKKDALEKRYLYNRHIPYWEWVFLRNYTLFKNNDKKIFVPCKERISNKNHHRFSLVYGDIYPTQDVTAIILKENTRESIEYVAAHLNSPQIFNWIKHKGIVKGNIVEFSRAPLARIPFRLIDFSNEKEVLIHNEITNLVKQFINTESIDLINKINQKLNILYED